MLRPGGPLRPQTRGLWSGTNAANLIRAIENLSRAEEETEKNGNCQDGNQHCSGLLFSLRGDHQQIMRTISENLFSGGGGGGGVVSSLDMSVNPGSSKMSEVAIKSKLNS